MSEPVELSIVVPIFNEEQSVAALHEETVHALDAMGLTGERAEIIYVDDCSTDRSLQRLLALREGDRRVCVIKFRRNFGQTSAIAAGFDEARGRVVVTMDGDLQNDPADIPGLIKELDRGYDVVAGWRRDRKDAFILRRLPSIIANRLIAGVTGVAIHDTGCTLKAFRRELVKSMAIYADQHRFLPVLSAGSGARVTEIVVNHRPRIHGSSKYGIGRATRVLLDLLTVKMISQFSQRPMQYFGLMGLAALLLGGGFAAASLYGLSLGATEGVAIDAPGWPLNPWEMSILTIMLLLFSVFVYFSFLGLLGELAVKASGMHRRSTLDRILNELH